ncbi:small multi-drug export protein [Bacillus infantis]|uniref:small multi-drug export protein n=1 Tax=Bacillus infantis TaxID=324767 RepID=UPI001CD3ADD3|nr:small multi-drug export protein [Bacillus infantis]MCA1035208.1 small multi-drug export protein [Bacillus infantis]
MIEWAQSASAFWQYVVIFIFSAAPWMDISIVVPLGVLWGLSPFWTGVLAFAGNLLLLILLAIFFEQFFQWRNRRREKKGAAGPTKRDKRSQQLWEKYGIPGLALLAPLLVGTDIAAVAAFSLGASRSRVLAWMTVSLAMWTIVFATASAYGVSLLYFTQEALLVSPPAVLPGNAS